MAIALIDADLVAFRCAATVQDYDPVDVAIYRVDVLMRQILEATESKEYKAYLTGRGNFRKAINTEYKANRKDKEPPCYLQDCREYLIKEWNAEVSQGCEADDLLGIEQTDETVVCSLDKDLLMIPGVHFNWNKLEYTHVDQLTGLRTFYKQMLIGDRSDNIFGVDKIGPVKAAKIIDHLTDEIDMLNQVFALYEWDNERFIMNAQCLWIMQNKGETWAQRTIHALDLPSQLKPAMERELEFMKSLMDDISMEQSTMEPLMSGTPVNGMEKDTTPTNQTALT
jgi:5'-3' exonuclease